MTLALTFVIREFGRHLSAKAAQEAQSASKHDVNRSIVSRTRPQILILITAVLCGAVNASDTNATGRQIANNPAQETQSVVSSSPFAGLSADQSITKTAGITSSELTQAIADLDPENGDSPDQAQSAPSHAEDRRDRVFYPGDTERPKPLFRKLLLNIAYDQADIFTGPFRVNRHNALEWLIPLAAVGALIPADTHLADAFENSKGQVRWGGRISDIGASYTLIPIVAGSYIYGAWRDNAKGREIGVLGTETLLDGLIVVGITKEIFRRNRPDERNPGDFWGGGSSFPSGHAIQIWSIASLLDHEYKNNRIVGITAYTLAGIVSAARIAAQKHFASDVVAGGAMGWFIGRYVYNTHMSHLAHQHSSLMPMITPDIEPLQRRYGVAVAFNLGGR
jgi:membrane-associated phospholipid phosphatase